MLSCDIINITIELFTLAMLGVLVVAGLVRPREVWRNALFLAAVALHAVCTCGDLFAWIFTQKPDALSCTLELTGNLVTYMSMPLAAVAYMYAAYVSVVHTFKVEGVFTKPLNLTL